MSTGLKLKPSAMLTIIFQPSNIRPDSPSSTKEFADNRWKLAATLYYRVSQKRIGRFLVQLSLLCTRLKYFFFY